MTERTGDLELRIARMTQMFKNLNGRPILQRCVGDHAHDERRVTARSSRDDDGQTREDRPEIAFVAGEDAIEP